MRKLMLIFAMLMVITLAQENVAQDNTIRINVGEKVVLSDTAGIVYTVIGKKVEWETGYYIRKTVTYKNQDVLNALNLKPQIKEWYYDNKWKEIEKPPVSLYWKERKIERKSQ